MIKRKTMKMNMKHDEINNNLEQSMGDGEHLQQHKCNNCGIKYRVKFN